MGIDVGFEMGIRVLRRVLRDASFLFCMGLRVVVEVGDEQAR